MSKEELANTIPVRPPRVNKNTNPIAHKVDAEKTIRTP
jgi:hypothetical protein